jgi:photosystem II stability/assembly factor-like uncharacterized protein
MSKLKNVLMGSAAALMMAGIASLPAQAVPAVNQEEAAQIRELESKGWATPSDLAARSLLVAAADLGERIVAVGQFGHVVISDDRGETWRQASQVPTQALLTGVYFVDDKTGYAVGHDAVIIKTEDGGDTWELKYSDPEAEMPLFSVMFADARNGIAVGAFSTALSTTDGGETWNLQSVIPDPPPPLEGLEYEPHLNGLFRGPSGSLFIAAETGFIFRSTDNGANWEPIKTPYFGSFWGGITLNDGSILIYGMRGNVWRSDDGGTTWAQVDTGSRKSFGGATLLEDGTVVLAGLNGGVAYSTDNGRSFDVVDRPDRKGYSAVVNGPDGHVIIFGEPGAVKHPDNAEAFRSGS